MDFKPTNEPFENEYPKLVRDNIPQIIKDRDGKDVRVKVLSNDDDYLESLLKKLVEEARELEHYLEDENMEEELADVMEIIETVLKLKGWSLEDIAKIQNEKRKKNGGFEKRIILLNKP